MPKNYTVFVDRRQSLFGAEFWRYIGRYVNKAKELYFLSILMAFLIYSYIVNVVSNGKGRDVWFSSIAAYGEVKENICPKVGLCVSEWVGIVVSVPLVESLGEVYFVKFLIVEVKVDGVFVPIHTPYVKLIGPCGVCIGEVR